MPTKGVIVWRGDTGRPENNYAMSRVEGVTDDTALATLITALLAYTDCNVARRSFNSVTSMTDSAPGADATVDRKAVLYMRNPTNLHVIKIEIPAPVSSATEFGDKYEKLTSAAEAAILAAINTACSTSYTVLGSRVWQRGT